MNATATRTCSGRNHSDTGTMTECPSCGARVVRGAKGHLSPMSTSHNTMAERYYCWTKHECSDLAVAAHTVEKARKVIDGTLAKGATVEVVKGRKVAKGTVGIVRVLSTDGPYGDRVALAVEGTEGLVWTAATNVSVVVDEAARAAAEQVVAEHDAKHAAWAERETAAQATYDALVAEHDERLAESQALAEGDERRAFYAKHEARLMEMFDLRTAAQAEMKAVQAERGW